MVLLNVLRHTLNNHYPLRCTLTNRAVTASPALQYTSVVQSASTFTSVQLWAAQCKGSRNFSSKRTVESLDESSVRGKHVLVRCDFNVPFDKKTGEIADTTRIISALPTIKLLRDKGAKVVLCSHRGRPKGKVVESLTMAPITAVLPGLLDCPVNGTTDCVGEETKEVISGMEEGDVVMLENLRFHEGETGNDPSFSKLLVDTTAAQVYVNDAFGCAHRAHASTEGVVEFIDGPCVAGLLLNKELEYLKDVVDSPKRPFASIVGGAKVSTKIGVLESLVDKSDKVILGGAMIFTFLKAMGLKVGSSMVEDDSVELAGKLIAAAKEKNTLLYLPQDVVVAEKFDESAEYKTVAVEDIPDGWYGLDIGEQSCKAIEKLVEDCNTIVWNGPMGVCEWENFSHGTVGVATALAKATERGAVTIVGGGDSVSAIEKLGLSDRMSHISTGGGASLELLEGLVLPGVAVLDPVEK